jgi:hypothetical protein
MHLYIYSFYYPFRYLIVKQNKHSELNFFWHCAVEEGCAQIDDNFAMSATIW